MKLTKIVIALASSIGLIAATKPVDVYSNADIHQRIQKLAAQSKTQGGGFAGETLDRYGNHLTMLAHREANGSSELHEHDADVFVIVEGDATLVSGGKMVNAHTESAGELRGSGVDGGEKQKLAVGDVVHIKANTPHQMLVAPGHTVTYFVVKVKQ
jgi:mannose-6-phosphate isomerase-like protein (cupin superfamily)